MDVEKTIEFLLADQASTHERVTRLENAQADLARAMSLLADRQGRLDEALNRFMEFTTEGFKQTDKRISDLASAIAELISRLPPQSTR